jgi:hypothetical protein
VFLIKSSKFINVRLVRIDPLVEGGSAISQRLEPSIFLEGSPEELSDHSTGEETWKEGELRIERLCQAGTPQG